MQMSALPARRALLAFALLFRVSLATGTSCAVDSGQRHVDGCAQAAPSSGNSLLQWDFFSKQAFMETRGASAVDESVGSSRHAQAVCVVRKGQCVDLPLTGRKPLPPPAAGKLDVELVVVRYRNDVRWLNALPEVPVIIYNRGGPESLLPAPRENLRIEQQENRGREDEAILRHIVNNYDRLAETTIFLQGWPFLHCGGALEALVDVIGIAQQKAGRAASFAQEQEYRSDIDGTGSLPGLVPLSRTFYKYSLPQGMLGYELSMVGTRSYRNPDRRASAARAHHMYKEMCESILDGPCPETQWVAEGAQWAVSSSRIRSRPRKDYERMMAIEEGYHDKLRGLVLEALWPVIWGAKDWAPIGTERDHEAEKQVSFLSTSMQSHPSEVISLFGVVERTFRAGDNYCQDRTQQEGHESLLWSCEDRIAFCDWQMGAAGAGAQTSVQFLQQRQRFRVSQAPQKPWAMSVRLTLPLLPGPTLALGAAGGGRSIQIRQPGANGTEWLMTQVSARNATGSGLFTLAQRDASGKGWQHLGCLSGTGYARLFPEQRLWQIRTTKDGHIRLQSGRVKLQAEVGANRLQCTPIGRRAAAQSTVFGLEALEVQG